MENVEYLGLKGSNPHSKGVEVEGWESAFLRKIIMTPNTTVSSTGRMSSTLRRPTGWKPVVLGTLLRQKLLPEV